MKVQVEELSPIERKLSIEVEAARVAQELDRAYQTLSRQVKIAGFRPGKVPRRLLEQRFKDQVEGDVVSRMVQTAYLEAIREHNVEAVGSPRVTNDRLKKDSPFSFEARVEVKPKLEVKDYKGLAFAAKDSRVEDAQVNEQLDRIRQGQSRLDPVQGRELAERGDYATVDFTATVDGNGFPGDRAEGITIEIADGELVQGNVAGLAGAKLGAVTEVPYAFPADYRVQEVQGKTALFRFTVKELKRKVVPELTDELAKDLGAESVDELKKKVRTDLDKAAKTRAERDDRDELIKALIAKNAFELPVAMVDAAVDQMLQGALMAMIRGGVDPRQLGLDFERMRAEMRPKAELEVRGQLLFEAVAEQERITASDEDLEKKLEALAEESGQSLSTVRKSVKSDEQRRGMLARIREAKTIEFLKGQASNKT